MSGGGTTSASSALHPHNVRTSVVLGEGRPPRRPHCNRSPWRLRSRRPALSSGGMTSASSALQPLTSASSAFPRSERVYPAIMPLGSISPGDPSWRKASRYVRTAGRQVNTLEGHRPDARTPAADIETISLQKIVNPSPLAEACTFLGRDDLRVVRTAPRTSAPPPRIEPRSQIHVSTFRPSH